MGHDTPEAAWAWDGEEANADYWERVGDTVYDAKAAGDVLVSVTSDQDLHTTVLVNPLRWAGITTHREMGVILTKTYLIQNVIGVYRLRR